MKLKQKLLFQMSTEMWSMLQQWFYIRKDSDGAVPVLYGVEQFVSNNTANNSDET